MSVCPSEAQLRRLGAESMGSATYQAIADHLEGCSNCSDALERSARQCASAGTENVPTLPEKGKYPAITGFEIKAELGRGGMGVVYLAWQAKLARHVALKVTPPVQGADDVVRRKCYAEAKAFSRASHANVVAVHDVGEDYPWFYLVLDYIAGGSLKDRLHGPLQPRVAARLTASVAEAVHAIHAAGMLHLDLKPANILLASSCEVPWERVVPKVSDFGVSRLVSPSQTTGSGPSLTGLCVGTPSYMAPEQICGNPKDLGPAADIHALGAILYELLTGRPPFQGASTVETMDQVRTQEPVRPTRLNKNVPRDLEIISLKCLEKEPARRYDSAGALAVDLRRWMEGRPIQARPVSMFEHAWRWCRRSPLIAGLAASLAATVGVALVVLLALYHTARSERARADEQRGAAERARQAAEENLQLASTVIERLEVLLVDAHWTSQTVGEDYFQDNAKLVREQTASIRKLRGFHHQFSLPTSRLEAQVAGELCTAGRLDEAAAVTKERIDLLRECRQREPGNGEYVWESVDALIYAGNLAGTERIEEALGYFDEATKLLMPAANGECAWRRRATDLSDAFVQISDRLTRMGRPEQAERAAIGQRKMLSLFETDGSARPGRALLKACVIADHGEWDRARRLVGAVALGMRSGDPKNLGVLEEAKDALHGWFVREARHWNNDHRDRWVEPRTLDADADRIVLLLVRLCEALGVPGDMACDSAGAGVMEGLTMMAASQRRTGQIDEAERTVSLFMAFAEQLVRKFPKVPIAHAALSDAFLQRYKNACRRADPAAIRRALTKSNEVLERALMLDPDDAVIRRLLRDRKRRLAGLPATS